MAEQGFEEQFPDEGTTTMPNRSRLMIAGIFIALSCSIILAVAIAGILFLRSSPPDTQSNSALTPSPAPLIPTNSPPQQSVPTVPPPLITLNRIAYITLDGELHTVDPDGDNPVAITSNRTNYRMPTWSPIGDQIAVIGSTHDRSGVYTFDRGETATNTLYEQSGFAPIYLFWSPNGKQLSFITNHAEGIGLYMAQPSLSNNAQLLITGQPFYWDWMPDNSRLLIHRDAGSADEQVRFMALDGDVDPSNLAVPGRFQAPGISADGHFWAFSEMQESGTHWLIVQNDAGMPATQTRHVGHIAFSWSPVSNQLAYISPDDERDAPYGILRLFIPETKQTIPLERTRVFAFFWSPNGKQIAYLTPSGENEMNAYLPDKVRGRLIAQPNEPFQFDLWVVDVTTQHKVRLLTFIPTREFLFQFLPFFDQYALSHRIWSPASDAVVLPAIIDEESTILVVPAGGGEPTSIGTGQMPFWSHQ